MNTQEQKRDEQRTNRLKVINQIKADYPHIEHNGDNILWKFFHYIPSVNCGKIVVNKRGQSVWESYPKNIGGLYLTKQQATEAIQAVFPKAIEKFNACKLALDELRKTMDFTIGNHIEGDTHGIDLEYQYISFSIDGFGFDFEYE
jgi:hypothetical protein